MATLVTAAELREALRLVVAAYRDLGPPPMVWGAQLEWRERHGEISYLAEQLTGGDAAYAVKALHKLLEGAEGGDAIRTP
jgi:hypothetical protein